MEKLCVKCGKPGKFRKRTVRQITKSGVVKEYHSESKACGKCIYQQNKERDLNVT